MDFKSGFLFGCGALAALAVIFLVAGSTTALDSAIQPINLSEYSGTLTVSGTGYVYADPDVAKISIGVINEADTSTKAMADNANTMDAVMKALRLLGIPDKDIQTSTISVQPKYEYQYPDSSSYIPPGPVRTRISGYTASNTVNIMVRDLSKVGPAIDAAYSAGANQINGVTFMLSEDRSAEVYKQALQKAVAEASGKARIIASAAGVEGIKLKTISESSSYYPVFYDSYAMEAKAAGAAAPTPVSPGQERVQATISMTYVYIPQ